MSDVFISYKAEERELVAPIAQRLGALGLDVWFDEKIRAGERWDAAIDEKLKSARAVVVCWSRRSVQSPWVVWEATYAQQAGVMAPVFLEVCTAPGPLSFVQGAQLADWRGQASHQGWLKLLAELERLLTRTDLVSKEEQRAAEGATPHISLKMTRPGPRPFVGRARYPSKVRLLGHDDGPLDLYRRCRRAVHLRRPLSATSRSERLCSSTM